MYVRNVIYLAYSSRLSSIHKTPFQTNRVLEHLPRIRLTHAMCVGNNRSNRLASSNVRTHHRQEREQTHQGVRVLASVFPQQGPVVTVMLRTHGAYMCTEGSGVRCRQDEPDQTRSHILLCLEVFVCASYAVIEVEICVCSSASCFWHFVHAPTKGHVLRTRRCWCMIDAHVLNRERFRSSNRFVLFFVFLFVLPLRPVWRAAPLRRQGQAQERHGELRL